MLKEFHIVALDNETNFSVRGIDGALDKNFKTLFEAAHYLRTEIKAEGGLIVVENGNSINRIPMTQFPRPEPK
jgi:hypothetical protein